MIAVIDYKAGNLTSVVKALRHLGAEVAVTDDPAIVRQAERIVLPGVGHFSATRRLDESGIADACGEAIQHGVPFLGICVGMQWLLEGSAEAPEQPGLGYFSGRCERFCDGNLKVPHVGWNSIEAVAGATLFRGLQPSEYFYFTHSYFVPTATLLRGNNGETGPAVAAVTEYGIPFAAAVERDNIFGVQFHPEKSGEAGLQVLRNFLEWQPC